MVEVQATADGRCNIVGQHSGRRKIGNSDCGGSRPVAGVDSTPFDVAVRSETDVRAEQEFFERSSWN